MMETRIHTTFSLTKLDPEHMDWTTVTEQLGVHPTRAQDAALSPGRIRFYDSELTEELPGMTILPAKDSPYHPYIGHAIWYLRTADTEDGHMESALRELELLLQGKGDTIRNLCSQYNLAAELDLYVYRKCGEPAEITLSAKCMQYWAAMGIDFSIILDELDEES